MYELETVRTWERNPQFYADTHRHQSGRPGALCLCARGRARAPRRVEASAGAAPRAGGPRQHQGVPGDLRQDRARKLARRRCTFIETDLPRAFSALDDLHILGDLADTSTEAAAAIKSPTSTISKPISRRGPRRRSGWAASGSSRS